MEEPAISFAPARTRRTRGTASAALVAAAAASLVAVLGSFHSLRVDAGQPSRASEVAMPGSAPAVDALAVQKLGLASLPPRASTSTTSARFRTI